ncbi:serine hydrolase [Pseudomonas sp. M30-35]|uniref:serine hydrolase domain-containing protein n=1 Tax=Pseudomonas sp. M30-35 TaxID=1981174 RepID=UPI000B3C5413|nr:serine hydrolase [Pseudomonas sp. M30-35]ARU89629.1 serine hydrolase [Pseudomonas sp. M30-35]
MPASILPKLSFALLLATASMTAHAENWPIPDWSTQAISQSAAQASALAALEGYAFPQRDDQTRKGVRTDALLVVRDGQVIYERYASPTKVSTPHLTWSVSKSIFAAVLGVAYGQGRFKLDAPVADYYPAMAAHPEIKMGHLLNWASGLDWQEDYEYAPLKSSVVAMLYTRGRSDMAAFIAEHPADAEPGQRFRYSSGDSTVLAAALQGMLSPDEYKNYPWTALFEPLGIDSAVWETDPKGTFVASSYAYMSARDLARVGLLMQRGGRWGERQLLPKAWVDFNLTPFANYQVNAEQPNDSIPGGQWWLNLALNGAAKPWPDAPQDTFAALGHWGQSLYVIPSEDLVIVRYADDRDGSYRHNQLLKLAQAAFVEVQP